MFGRKAAVDFVLPGLISQALYLDLQQLILLMAFRSKYSQMLIKTERIDKEERLLMLWVPGSHYLVAIIRSEQLSAKWSGYKFSS